MRWLVLLSQSGGGGTVNLSSQQNNARRTGSADGSDRGAPGNSTQWLDCSTRHKWSCKAAC